MNRSKFIKILGLVAISPKLLVPKEKETVIPHDSKNDEIRNLMDTGRLEYLPQVVSEHSIPDDYFDINKIKPLEIESLMLTLKS